MAFAKRGFHTFSDAISYAMWGSSASATTSGTGAAVALASQPVASDPRDQTLRFSLGGSSGNAYLNHMVRWLPGGEPMGVGNTGYTIAWVRCRFCLTASTLGTSGDVCLLAIVSGSTRSYGVYLNSSRQLVVKYTPSGGSITLLGNGSDLVSLGEWFNVLLHIDQSTGTITCKLKRASDPDYITQYTQSGLSNPSAFGRLYVGLIENQLSGSSNLNLYLDDIAISDIEEDETKVHRYLIGSGTRDATQTKAVPILFCTSTMFKSATHCRVQCDTDGSFASPTSGSWVDFATYRKRSMTPCPLSGLTPATTYHCRFQIATAADAGSVIYTSDTYRFWTLRPAGQPNDELELIGSCFNGNANAHPYSEIDYVAGAIEESNKPYAGFKTLGDFGYEAGSWQNTETLYGPHQTEANFQQKIREAFSDYEMDRLSRLGVILGQLDDHEVINNFDATSFGSGVLANNYPARSSSNYDPGTTVGQLVTRGLDVWNECFANHLIDKAGAYYKSWINGRIRTLLIDTRTERNPGSSLYVSATQLSWIESEIDSFSESDDEDVLVIMSNGVINELFSNTEEGWETIAPAQYYNFISYLNDNVPSTKKVFFVSGDKHVGWGFHRRQETAEGVQATNPAILGELVTSGIAATFFIDTSTKFTDEIGYVESYYTPVTTDAPAVGEAMRCSPALLTYTSYSLRLQSWAFDGQSLDAYVYEDEPPESPAAYVGTRPVIKSYIGSQLVTATH